MNLLAHIPQREEGLIKREGALVIVEEEVAVGKGADVSINVIS